MEQTGILWASQQYEEAIQIHFDPSYAHDLSRFKYRDLETYLILDKKLTEIRDRMHLLQEEMEIVLEELKANVPCESAKHFPLAEDTLYMNAHSKKRWKELLPSMKSWESLCDSGSSAFKQLEAQVQLGDSASVEALRSDSLRWFNFRLCLDRDQLRELDSLLLALSSSGVSFDKMKEEMKPLGKVFEELTQRIQEWQKVLPRLMDSIPNLDDR